MRNQSLLGTLTLLFVFATGSGSPEVRPTNFEVFSAQVDSLSLAVTRLLTAEHDSSVTVKAGSRTIDDLVRQRVIERLLNHNFSVSEVGSVGTVVRLHIPVFIVNYSSPVSSHIFGASDVVRTMKSEYDVEVSDSGRVAFAKSFQMAYSDTVSESDIPALESGTYNFLRGRLDSRSLFDTVLQPVLFVASAAVIVYLFFTLRGS